MNEIRDLLIGIDFGKETTQICYYDRKADEPRSLSLKAGENSYEIPTALLRKPEEDAYTVGMPEDLAAQEKGSGLIENLYELSGTEEKISLGDTGKEPWEFVEIFIRGVLRFLGVMNEVRNTSALAIAAAELPPERVSNLKKACARIGFEGERLILLDYDESFYYHVMTQRKELPSRSTAWYHFDGNQVIYRKMSMNSSAKPIVVKMEEKEDCTLPADAQERDEAFAVFIQKTLGQEMFSSIQITGKGFDQSWALRSIRILCFGKRKVYFGNNLYARGACAAAKERTENHSLKNFLFLGKSLVRSDVGMEVRMMGSPAYYPMIRSGSNWFDCSCTCELLLDQMEELIFEVSTSDEPEKKRISMKLPGLPKRPPKTTRLLLEMHYISEEQCRIQVTDLGFGEMFPSSGKTWTETVVW